jgi:hypothetical protein
VRDGIQPGPGFVERPFHLAAPPRHVPWSTRVRLLFGGLGVFAWLFLAVGSSIGSSFLRNADLRSWYQFYGASSSVVGVSTGCSRTSASEGGSKGRGGTPIFANGYRFEADGEQLEGVSYATGTCLGAHTEVTVEYPAGQPRISRIAGMRRAIFGPSIAFVLIFPVVGLGLVGASLWRGRRELRLLEHGKLAMGTLLGVDATNVSVNDRRVMKVRLAIVTESGARQEVQVRTTNPEVLEDEPQERILFDPASPSRAVAWDLLPKGTSVDSAGQIEPSHPFKALLLLLPPAVAAVAHALALGFL